jgi:hypothetical protein
VGTLPRLGVVGQRLTDGNKQALKFLDVLLSIVELLLR